MQAYHWYVSVGVDDPVHVPLFADKVAPTLAAPVSVGLVVAAVCVNTLVLVLTDSDDTGSVPALVPVTLTVMYFPRWVDVRV